MDKSLLKLPYKLIDISDNGEQFTLSFGSFDSTQSERSVMRGGLLGGFEAAYSCEGMENAFECDITVGELYSFYIQLESVYECLPGGEPVAVLEGSGERPTKMMIAFDRQGHFTVSGKILNKATACKSGIVFEITLDTVFIYDILKAMESFFDELKRLQGHGIFI